MKKKNIIKKKKLNFERKNNYKVSLLEQEDKECTFFPKINDDYNNRYIHRIKNINKNQNLNYKKEKNNYEKAENFSFMPNINKLNIKTIFKDNDYSKFWLKKNKYYINQRLKNINCKNNRKKNTIDFQLLNLNEKSNINKLNNSLENTQRIPVKININYIKKLLHEELQNTKSDEEIVQ